MNFRRKAVTRIAATMLSPLALSLPRPSAAQPAVEAWPARPVRILVGFAAGGGADAVARTLATRLAEQLGQNVLVENRPGASSTIAADALSKSPADGYTLMLADSSLLIAARAMQKLSFDAQKSFEPVAPVAIAPLTIAVATSSPIRSLEDLAAAAKAGALTYATSGVGTVHHLAMEYLESLARIQMTHLPYRGASQILPDLIGGQIPVAVLSAGAALPQVKAGKVRVLGVTSPVTFADAPDWRAVADWLPGFDASPRLFLLAPGGTPTSVLRRLEAETRAALAQPTVADALAKQGAVPTAGSSADLARAMRAESTRWDELIRRANITLQ